MSIRRWFAPALLPLLVLATPGCAVSEAEGESSGAAVAAGLGALAPTSMKILEVDAVNEGATGVHSWVTYLTATPGNGGASDEVGLLAYGVNQDRVGMSVLYYDLRRGALAAYESKSTRDACAGTAGGSGCDAVADSSMRLYRAELAHILDAFPASRPSSNSTHVLSLGREDACLSVVISGLIVLATAGIGATLMVPSVPLAVGATAIAVGAAAGAAVGVTSLVGMSAILHGAGKSVSVAVMEGAGKAGNEFAADVSSCLRGS